MTGTREESVFSLDYEKLGKALVSTAFASLELDHARISNTVRDYLNHPGFDFGPEERWVLDAFLVRAEKLFAPGDQGRMYELIHCKLPPKHEGVCKP
jgi:hypothetical protein